MTGISFAGFIAAVEGKFSENVNWWRLRTLTFHSDFIFIHI